MSGKQVKLFLADGTPGGLTTAEITNWTGHVLTGRRSDLARLLARDELARTGVYLLLGEDDDGDALGYIGETDELGKRLRGHDRDKDFWDRVVVISSKDANLTKAHVRYLESTLITLAQRAGRIALQNGTQPPVKGLPEADVSDMDYFVEQLQIVLPVLGINVIRVPAAAPAATPVPVTASLSPVFHLRHVRLGVDATAQQVDGEFTLLAGSTIVAGIRTSASHRASTAQAYAKLAVQHAKLVRDGLVVVHGATAEVVRDVPFTSPSTAGAVALGRSCNGRASWVTDDGHTFGEWESRGV